MTRRKMVLALVLLSLFGGKQKGAQAATPPPQEISADSVSEFCGMLMAEHSGPKGQILVRDRDAPYWFSSVRDTIAFTILPEMPKNISAIYVSDMARARNWEQPEPGAWIEAGKAWYVIGSRRRSGMGAEEVVPFGGQAAAARFAQENGGRVVRLKDIPSSYVLPETDRVQ